MARVVKNRNFVRQMGRPENSRNWQRAAATAGLASIRRYTPVRFGSLRSSLFSRVIYRNGTTYILYGTMLKYGLYQEVGTGIYGPVGRYITPKRAKLLAWNDPRPGSAGGPQEGPWHFAKRVKGSPPTLYMYRGLDAVFGNATSYARTGGRSF